MNASKLLAPPPSSCERKTPANHPHTAPTSPPSPYLCFFYFHVFGKGDAHSPARYFFRLPPRIFCLRRHRNLYWNLFFTICLEPLPEGIFARHMQKDKGGCRVGWDSPKRKHTIFCANFNLKLIFWVVCTDSEIWV